jgi:hypothetical protein
MLFNSIQSKIILLLGLICIILTLIKYFSLKLIIAEIIIFYLIAQETECKLYGGCKLSSNLSLIVPIIIVLLFVIDFIGVLDTYKNSLIKLYDNVKNMNESHLINILKNDITDMNDMNDITDITDITDMNDMN